MRILLINRYFGGQQTPTGRMLSDLARELQRRGHEVAVLASKSKYVGSEMSPGENEGIELVHVRELKGGRLLRWASFWFRSLFSLASSRWDRCLLLTDPPFLPFAAWLTRLGRGPQQRLYWWTMDLYPEALVPAGLIGENTFAYRCLRGLNELGLRQMSGVAVLGPCQLRRLQTYRHWKPDEDFAAVVPPWDRRTIRPVEPRANKVLNRLGCQEKKVALYAGNLGEGHLVIPFIEAARWFHHQGRSDWRFVFVVRGVGRRELEAKGADLPNLFVSDYLPEAETPDLLGSATVHLVSMKPGWEGIIVPSKFYGTLQTCAPVLFLGPLNADTAVEIQAKARGISLPPAATGEEVARALDELAAPAWKREPQTDTNEPERIAEFLTRSSSL